MNIPNNRISHVFTAEQMQTLRDFVRSIKEVIAPLEGQISTDTRSLNKIEGNNKTFVQDSLRVMRENPALVPAHVNIAEAEKDLQLHEQVDELLVGFSYIFDILRGAQLQAGHEVYKAGLDTYNTIQRAAESGVPGAVALYDLLKGRFAKQGKRRAAEPDDNILKQ